MDAARTLARPGADSTRTRRGSGLNGGVMPAARYRHAIGTIERLSTTVRRTGIVL